MPNSALPDHLNPDKNPDAWKNTDWDNKWQRWLLPFKGWFAYGPRATEWWAKWREFPFIVFALFGEGSSRWETSGGELSLRAKNLPILWYQPYPVYLSRVQYWCRWSFNIQWPFFISFHFYFKEKHVPPYTESGNTDGTLFFCYFGAHRDGDKVYWFPSAYMGFNWK